MKTSFASFALLLGLSICAVAADAPPIELKKQSSFTMEASGRNPFWPIGFKPTAKAAVSSEPNAPELPPSVFLLSSITIDQGTKFAIVNGRPMKEGQVFGLQLGNQTYQLTLKRIEDGRVVLGRRDIEIVVPLRRK